MIQAHNLELCGCQKRASRLLTNLQTPYKKGQIKISEKSYGE
jgi:hypothetical protein